MLALKIGFEQGRVVSRDGAGDAGGEQGRKRVLGK